MVSQQDYRVSREWARRPDDERFLSLEDLHQAVKSRQDNSRVAVTETSAMKVYGTEENELVVNTELGPKLFNNWSFSQFSSVAGAPAGYLKKLSAPLAAANLNYGLARSLREKSALLVNGHDTLRAITSETYGRIWDRQVVEAVMKVTEDTTWKIPSSSYSASDPKRATTLYASDRDVFIFLVDPEHPIEVPGTDKPVFRGFYAWNSEVGSQVFGLATFLYQTVCDNRIIWGVSHKSELRIRHSAGAPERFLNEGKKTLIEYSNESVSPIIDRIKRAQSIKVGQDEKEVRDFLKKRGLTLSQIDDSISNVKQEGKDFTNAWELTEGITASARSIPNSDNRTYLERTAGKILDTVTR